MVAQARGHTLTSVSPARTGTQVSLAVQSASVDAFHSGIGIASSLVALGGLIGLAGIRSPRRLVRCEDCAGGQLPGQPFDAARRRAPRVRHRDAASRPTARRAASHVRSAPRDFTQPTRPEVDERFGTPAIYQNRTRFRVSPGLATTASAR